MYIYHSWFVHVYTDEYNAFVSQHGLNMLSDKCIDMIRTHDSYMCILMNTIPVEWYMCVHWRVRVHTKKDVWRGIKASSFFKLILFLTRGMKAPTTPTSFGAFIPVSGLLHRNNADEFPGMHVENMQRCMLIANVEC